MSQIQNPAVPQLPVMPAAYDQRQLEQLTRDLRTYFNKLRAAMDPVLFGFNHAAAFMRTTTATNPVANAENLVEFDVSGDGFGITLDAGNPSRVVVARGGLYNFQFSAQLDKTGGGASHAHMWFKINGTAVPYSASKEVISGPNDEAVISWNYLTLMSAGDYFELAWASPDTTMVLLAEAAASPVPAIPSVLLTATYVYPNGEF